MIRSLEGIRNLAKSDKSRREFCDEFLEEVAHLVEAEAGIVWDASNGQGFRAISQFSKNDEPSRLNFSRDEHDRLLAKAAGEDSPIMVRHQTNSRDESSVTGSDQPALLLGKFIRGGRYLLELMVAGEVATAEASKHRMQQFGLALQAVHDSQDGLLSNQTTPTHTNPETSLRDFSAEALSQYLTAIHGSIDLKLTSSNVANETRRLMDCDRVSVLIFHRGKFRVFAISGQPSVNRRSNTTRLLEQVSSRILKTGQPFWYPTEAELPSQISQVLDEYLSISATRSMVIVPIHERQEQAVVDPEALEGTNRPNPVIGGVVYEHCHERWERTAIESKIDLMSEHSGCAIRNARQHQQLFLYPLWKLLGKSKLLTAPRMLPKTVLAILAVLVAISVLLFWQVDFYVTGDGVLMPRAYKPVFSENVGKVDQLLVKHGDEVKPDQTLVIMSSKDHEYRVQDLKMEVEMARQRLTNLKDQRYSEDAEEKIEEKIVSQKLMVENLLAQQRNLQRISDSMTVRSPIQGRIITWDLEHQLENRVVQPGTQLMEVADVTEGWILEIDLPIRREGHVSRFQREHQDEELRVSFLLAVDTTRRFTARVAEIEESVSVNSDNEQVIKIKALIDDEDISIDQVRSGVTAKIYCGTSSLGYQLLHDVGEAFNKYVWFPLF